MLSDKRESMQPSYQRQSLEIPPHQDSRFTTDKMNPSSALLQDLLREKKASQHARRTSHQGDNAAFERQVQSSPMAPSGPRHVSKSSDRRISGHPAPKEMGLREMEEYISKINKQNFDLKLELFHRRQRSEALEAKAEKVDELQAGNDELRQVNDDLLLELEKRDVAVEEAVALICDLETRIDQLEAQLDHDGSTRPTQPLAGDSEAPKMPQPPVTPSPSHASRQESQAKKMTKRSPSPTRNQQNRPDRSLLHSPSFLRDDNPSTSALRGLFLKDGGSPTNGLSMGQPSIRSLRRADSFFSQDDDYPDTAEADTFSLNPRRLSLLSESSFVSVYGKEKDKVTPSTAHRNADTTSPTYADASFARSLSPQEGMIKTWIENRDHPASPSKKHVTSARPDQFSSIGELLEPQKPTQKVTQPSISPVSSNKQRQQKSPHQRVQSSVKPSFAGPIFGSGVLPPTPGTMSTTTLGGRSSNQSIATERSVPGASQPSSARRIAADNQLCGGPFIDETTDIEVSDDERPLIAAPSSTQNAFNYPHDHSWTQRPQRPSFGSQPANVAPNGQDTGAMRPPRPLSYALPSRSNQKTAQQSPTPSGKGSTASKPGPSIVRRTSIQKDQGPFLPSDPPRPLPSRSKSSHTTTSQAPTQTLASRLFRRSPSCGTAPAQHQPTNPPPLQPAMTSPDSKPRPSRPSSLYLGSTSHQPTSTAPIKVSRATRPGTAGGPPPADSRRHSVAVEPSDGDILIPNGGEIGQVKQVRQQQHQQQGKRLSVGTIGRSASLKIKEGFGRMK